MCVAFEQCNGGRRELHIFMLGLSPPLPYSQETSPGPHIVGMKEFYQQTKNISTADFYGIERKGIERRLFKEARFKVC